jgi:sugar O-acyltransferase (sialic acid O-acetyltransferase NeuD family)
MPKSKRSARAKAAPRKLVLFGTGDVARLAHVYFSTDSTYEVVAFTVDRAFCKGTSFENLPLVPFDAVAREFPPARHAMFVALSYSNMNALRAARYADAKRMGYTLASYVSSRCTYLSEHPPGDNCFILEDNTIQPFVRIGNNVTLWSGNHIGHDTTIGDHCFLASQIVVSGRVTVGPHTFIGVNATLRNAITIAPRTLIGAGAVIMSDTIEGGVYLPPRATLAEKRSDQVKL